MKRIIRLAGFLAVLAVVQLATQNTRAGEADVVGVDVRLSGDGAYDFSVTVTHADAGWDHYANRWEVVGEDGTIFGTRVLAHPHDNEQPFTRSMSGIAIPAGVTSVIVRAADSVHELGGKEITLALPGL